MFDKYTYDAFNWCVFKRIPFVIYISSGEKEGKFYSAPSLLDSSSEKKCDKGFFIGTFNQRSDDFLWIPFELNAYETVKRKNSLPTGPSEDNRPVPADTVREEYLEDIRKLREELEKRAGKTIISRVKTEYFFINEAFDLMESLFISSPTSFCYCFYHPLLGFWMGATPELLMLSYSFPEHKAFATMALAGTMPKDQEWDEKNIKEFTIVRDDIMSRLTGKGLSPVSDGDYDKYYGEIKHKCQTILCDQENFSNAEIIDILNPSAAIAGYPLEDALADIKRIEKHDRACYGGVVGVVEGDEVKAYANIRCINFNKSRYTFYTGGGITPDSVPEDEWQETNRKMHAILKKMEPK